ncbi:MAG: aminoacyl-tRNA deacylase [Stygiobacter sp. RIFOXYC12_FULL_38_8]|nr:MAG: aminoacyl-tRNA deacylase [Stygiobacter sp. GWC2_38_9]OGU81986.1 MAG: aminoacyl-tRNA deacylase [Stygiobacter sp. RIFOXYA12_FULL_38_9]OGV07129.1 MAG: aminoacyl-tRNA deacylase [Stygiobacter sp. RIFOXYB2_FULL_37_11]OGV12354.1 MAG: aminoacyl-tRNA deacylase [Stygiobacter sp. RIFOXYC2_FULL_38_25]OGV18035.1 MAG: aminoacyl-tRNA deacylase [Stygiobacter sp. RIFOXYA2_FULL_38_8]OGV25223.1 MAG: aminoacyl-tRNA deacylase [Stygiobacter sp. RIFOXYC12_FULL_38_8]OGV83094.1 MAG: aminoacyl-tRNA deacylase [
MAENVLKTNAVRILESKNIVHSTVEYESDENEIDAVSVANKIGAEPETVFKTLVARNERNELLVFVIPGNFELNLKKAAKASGSKSIELIKVKELQPLTGYIRGGCSPIGMKKLFPTFIDETAQLNEKIYCSAGVRGMQLHLSPTDLLGVVEGEFCDLI